MLDSWVGFWYDSWFDYCANDKDEMTDSLQLTNDLVSSYRDAADAVEGIMREHRMAMAVFDLQDTVGFGILAMHRWLRCIEQWHEWVSESADRYSEKQHQKLKQNEHELLSSGDRLLCLIETAKDSGFSIDHEDSFRALLETIRGSAAPISAEFQRSVLRQLFDGAIADYRQGVLEETSNPWS